MLSTVLIIDKRKELSTKYKKCIDNTETNTIIAKSLRDAMILVQSLDPEMIIISDSIEEDLANFCQKIRALTYNTRPIIIALSKSADTNDRIKVLEAGADDFLSEPVNIEEFKMRIKAHLRRDVESNLDNKTLLPNQKFVRKTLKRVLSSENLAVLLIDITRLDKYKAIYTELASDKIVQTFIAIAKSALETSDFIGQICENRFIIVTNKYSAEKLASYLAFAFDTVVPKFYSDIDSQRGYMLLKGDRYAGMRVNFVSLEIGGIVEGFNLIRSVDTLLEKLNETKQLAKLPYGSNYAIERAKLSATDSIAKDFFTNKIYINVEDESLNLLIRTSLELQGYDILDELTKDCTKIPALIIYDINESFEKLELIKSLKKSTDYSNTKIIVTSTLHDKSRILDSGADLYLPKPYEISDLIQWIEFFFKE